jgi:hypothetical protein
VLQLSVALSASFTIRVRTLWIIIPAITIYALESADCGLEGVVGGGVVLGEHAAAAAVEVDGGEGEVRHGCR